ncbi:unnamed protein product [Pieris brassicae]|uniref:BTB domain-containing protein n=1 Tax=Pieris brassicae TaxID=7116 RepID=A0A9P0XGR1_PIEBR|nr:unnamed protein product [Pieris brassicae]
MAPIRYSLHYEDYSEHLMSRFGKLLQMQSFVDMTLMCSSHTLRVHKAVLAASSAYFQDVLQKQTGEPLIILKMRFGVMKCLVEFMYCGKTQCPEEHLDELVSAAQFLKIKGLSKVTKEGLGITNTSELPVFTPPVVINGPPQSMTDLHAQDNLETKSIDQAATNTSQSMDNRNTQDTVVRIPFDIENKGMSSGDFDLRSIRPRRGRPSMRSGPWDSSGLIGRAAERALMRREQDSRKAIHHLKNLQSRQMQDYMDRTLTQAVSSICEPESSTHSYMNIDSDLMYMDQTVSSNMLDPPISFSKDSSVNETSKSSDSGTAMTQYVNALKSAGLPTDLPILFESSDGSYINVNEQVLLDMVQSNEIKYEVIEQPDIIEKVSDPSEIKSIDDLSKSIERGEILMGSNNYTSRNSFAKDNIAHQDAITTLNSILPDSLESFNENPNYVVLGSGLQNSNTMDTESTNDFTCIESDMQFFTKSMSEDVKNYYQQQQLNDPRDTLCPVTNSLDSSFSMSLLDTKNASLGEGISQQYNPLNPERNDDCYDFSMQLSQSSHFKEEIDCLISPPKPADSDRFDGTSVNRVQEQDEIMKDLMDLESNIRNIQDDSDTILAKHKEQDSSVHFESLNHVFNSESTTNGDVRKTDISDSFSPTIPHDLDWDKENLAPVTAETKSTVDFSDVLKTNEWTGCEEHNNDNDTNKVLGGDFSTLQEDIPFAVGLLPMKTQSQTVEDSKCKRKLSDDDLCNVDAKCLKRKVKHKIKD